MSGWLLDTNILSELRKPKPEARVVEFVATQPLDRLYVSTLTFAEIRFDIEKLADAGKRYEICGYKINCVLCSPLAFSM